MTREEAKELLPIIEAYSKGKTIQIWDDSKWVNLDVAAFGASPDKYRIKPESKYRSFKTQEECWQEMQKHQPFGWIKSNNNNDLYNVSAMNYKGITFIAVYYTFSESFERFTFADGTPFGIKKN